jgi:hypothetical protein
MRLGESVDARIPWVRLVHDLDGARAMRSPGPKLRAIRRAAEGLGDALRAGPQVVAVRTLPLTTLLYPTGFAFNHAVPLALPFVVMSHRCLLVQVRAAGALKNILWNPSDYNSSLATPYFAKLVDLTGERLARRITTQGDPIETQLARLGLSPDDIDLIAFDHFHTQDLRPLLGCDVPNAAGERQRAK